MLLRAYACRARTRARALLSFSAPPSSTQTYTHTYKHTKTLSHKYQRTQIDTHTHIYIYLHVYVCIHVSRLRIHTCMHKVPTKHEHLKERHTSHGLLVRKSTATHCNTLQHTATHCNTHCNWGRCVRVMVSSCKTHLHNLFASPVCTATHTTFENVATHTTFEGEAYESWSSHARITSTIWWRCVRVMVSSCANRLQHTATHSNTLPHAQ